MPATLQMGGGMAQGAAEVQALLPIYQREMIEAQTNGLPFPQNFQAWLQEKQAENAQKIMPR